MILPLSLWVDSIAVFQLIALLPSTLCYGRKIGMARGVAVVYLILIYAKYHFTLSLISIVLGTRVALLTGLFFGIYPARQAAMLNPIMALRSE